MFSISKTYLFFSPFPSLHQGRCSSPRGLGVDPSVHQLLCFLILSMPGQVLPVLIESDYNFSDMYLLWFTSAVLLKDLIISGLDHYSYLLNGLPAFLLYSP